MGISVNIVSGNYRPRLLRAREDRACEDQAGFPPGNGCTDYIFVWGISDQWDAVVKLVRSWLLGMEVAGSSPPGVGQSSHLAALWWPWPLSWKLMYINKGSKRLKISSAGLRSFFLHPKAAPGSVSIMKSHEVAFREQVYHRSFPFYLDLYAENNLRPISCSLTSFDPSSPELMFLKSASTVHHLWNFATKVITQADWFSCENRGTGNCWDTKLPDLDIAHYTAILIKASCKFQVLLDRLNKTRYAWDEICTCKV